ncbi:hypothetical protein QZH41_009361, partial [Actinostola sp. cb2023]
TNLDGDNGKLNSQAQGGSYTSGKTLPSFEGSSLSVANPMRSALKPSKIGSSLALRNISNIPIDGTLSRTQCTPSRQGTQYPSSKYIALLLQLKSNS